MGAGGSVGSGSGLAGDDGLGFVTKEVARAQLGDSFDDAKFDEAGKQEPRDGTPRSRTGDTALAEPEGSLLSPSCVPDSMGSLARHLVTPTLDFHREGIFRPMEIGND